MIRTVAPWLARRRRARRSTAEAGRQPANGAARERRGLLSPTTVEAFLWTWIVAALAAYLWQFRDIIPAALRILF